MTIRRSPTLRMHALQAEYGDCLLVECPDGRDRRHLLIDGGPPRTYADRLRPVLARLAREGWDIDLAVLSHIDNDHVTGLLDYLRELRDGQNGARKTAVPRVRELWHNSFSQAAGGRDVAPLARQILAQSRSAAPMRRLATVVSGVAEGDALSALAAELTLPLNAAFAGRHVMTKAAEPGSVGDVTVHVAGPSQAVLDKLREEWLEWHRKHASRASPAAAIAADRSVPNLSSIVMLLDWQGRRLLLTGDGRGDQILEGLDDVGHLSGGRIHVSVLKMPHHGSSRNVKPDFLNAVTADRYVFSANGRYGNPDLQCLKWTVEAARDGGRRVELAFTNRVPVIDALLGECPPDEYGYRVRVRSARHRALSLDV